VPTTRFILVRHGETLANRDMRFIGSRDDVLTEHGGVQAEQIARALSFLPLAAVYSSPRRRAYRTALPLAARHQLEPRLLDDLRECDFGRWEGLSRGEVMQLSARDADHLLAWERDPALAPPAGESLEAMERRVGAAIAGLAERHPDQTLALVSHVGPIKALVCAALGAPISTARRIFLDPATLSVVDWQRPYPIVRLLNSHCHMGWEQARWM
jgi:broad specificity phosphatase PhoE